MPSVSLAVSPWHSSTWHVVAYREATYQACPGAPVQSAGSCDKCGQSIRYVVTLKSEAGQTADVGRDCAETLIGGAELAEIRNAERRYQEEQYRASPEYAADKARREARETARTARAAVAEVECALSLYGLRAIKASEACSTWERDRAEHEEGEILSGDSNGAEGWDDKLREWLTPAVWRAMFAASVPSSRHHAATPGTRLKGVMVTLFRKAAYPTQYGTTYVDTYVTAAGEVLVWKGVGSRIETGAGDSRPVSIGERVLLTGTIKGHGEYNGQPQTSVSRCKVEST